MIQQKLELPGIERIRNRFLGFKDLGTQARACEIEIDAHLNGPDADLAICPSPLIFLIDQFVQESEALIAANPQSVNA